jgi:hypothetical protein
MIFQRTIVEHHVSMALRHSQPAACLRRTGKALVIEQSASIRINPWLPG